MSDHQKLKYTQTVQKEHVLTQIINFCSNRSLRLLEAVRTKHQIARVIDYGGKLLDPDLPFEFRSSNAPWFIRL